MHMIIPHWLSFIKDPEVFLIFAIPILKNVLFLFWWNLLLKYFLSQSWNQTTGFNIGAIIQTGGHRSGYLRVCTCTADPASSLLSCTSSLREWPLPALWKCNNQRSLLSSLRGQGCSIITHSKVMAIWKIGSHIFGHTTICELCTDTSLSRAN